MSNTKKKGEKMFEKFTRDKGSCAPCVSSNSSRFVFNKATVNMFGLELGKHCELFFNKKEKQIGFRFLDTPSESSYKVSRISKNNSTLTVSGRAFSLHYKIDMAQIKKHRGRDIDGMLVINI